MYKKGVSMNLKTHNHRTSAFRIELDTTEMVPGHINASIESRCTAIGFLQDMSDTIILGITRMK